MWLVSTLASGTLPSTCPRRIELATPSSVGGTGASDAVMEETGNCSMPPVAVEVVKAAHVLVDLDDRLLQRHGEEDAIGSPCFTPSLTQPTKPCTE